MEGYSTLYTKTDLNERMLGENRKPLAKKFKIKT